MTAPEGYCCSVVCSKSKSSAEQSKPAKIGTFSRIAITVVTVRAIEEMSKSRSLSHGSTPHATANHSADSALETGFSASLNPRRVIRSLEDTSAQDGEEGSRVVGNLAL